MENSKKAAYIYLGLISQKEKSPGKLKLVLNFPIYERVFQLKPYFIYLMLIFIYVAEHRKKHKEMP